MESYPLTPEGAADKLAELYALADPALATHAVAIAVDFKAWLKSNFDLTPAQETYVNGMSADAARFFGAQCSACFLNRIAITLVYPAPPGTQGYIKWTDSTSTIKMETDGAGNHVLTGALTFTVSYKS